MTEEQIFGNLEKATLKEKFAMKVNELEISGWSFSSLGSEILIEIFIDDEKIGEMKTGFERPDVYELNHTSIAALNSGFIGKINVEKINNGEHVLKVISRSDLNEKQLRSEKFKLGDSK